MQQQLTDIQQIVEDVLKLAKEKGATQAEASMSKVKGIAVSSRLKEVETVEFTNDGGLGITVYKGQRKGSASTADLSPDALRLTVEKAIEIAKYTGEDDCSGLADKALMAFEPQDLDLYHPVELNTDFAIEQVIKAETAALGCDPRITNSDGASYNANLGTKVYGNSHGLNVGYNSSRYSMSCVVIGEQDGDMQRDYSYTVDRQANLMASPEQIGKESAEFTLARLGARQIKTAKVPVLFDKEIASGLIGHFISAISGGNLYRKSSFLLDKLGEQVLPSWFNISERPFIMRGLASSAFDHEGVRTKDSEIVTDGVLNQYLLTSYSARKMKMQTTGHAGGIHNWLIKSSGQSDQQMLAELGTGLLVTELMGQGVNVVTGDYSRGAAGFWVENGVIQYPVHEITIAGNLADMLKNIVAVGAEIESRGSIQTGSILIDNMQVAGD
ncbi:MAG: metalloprotease PmbA [Paraglaciecola chathamensis]|jgi:PmbA protein|uniref:Metalloprotease PmbA n=2 Tax=Paraglaciecola chathamensis TaxID=368405 RepID=A0ABS0WE78_9ALTE|nr:MULTISPECIES: metalloprotease PmbA [Paraglaciecola]MBJ2136780.1 metalloprotease PmbA [Paraglaciecola chathamensis]MDO6558827.1 metalloprotease PmbA [Paraglaciecola chathamensis]MDO6839545.1 metalloprotease PmbA [Paraglaciecola chathamensis]GAC05085.1 microcin-processing peptidase 1 [Paraglaciecola agarilytica NO2]|tara:strand:- start:505 stop:1830 length:1326 start_codon:yes stop_codon:yes gene_type:complete